MTPAVGSEEKVSNWFVPLSADQRTLRECHAELAAFGLKQDDVPWLIQFVENPKYDLPGVEIFHGATDLETHDYIHILLGRGLLPKDEAFVLGFTMGSTDRVSTSEEKLFAFFWGGRRFGWARAVLPILPIAIISGVVFQKGGNGHNALPKQFSQLSLAALATGKLAVNPVVARNEVSIKAGPEKAAQHILYLVDESLRPDYISTVPGNNLTPNFASFAAQLVNFGPAASGAICSNYSNAILRFMPSRADLGGAISSNPTIWHYAKAAGFRTVYIDAQGHAIENATRMQNFMTPAERKWIDDFYPLAEVDSKSADQALLEIIEKEFAKPGPVFIYANKQGMHFPYDQNYDTARGPLHPEQSEVGSIEDKSMLNSYRNAVDWNVDQFFADFAKRISMKDLAMVYTSDHGQFFAPGEATHCKSSDSHPQMAYVPLFAYVDSAAGMTELAGGAAQSRGRANHFQIAPTMMHWMGFAEADIAAHYPESLHTGTRFEPAYALADIFGLFSSNVEWVKLDLEKDYLETDVARIAGNQTVLIKQ